MTRGMRWTSCTLRLECGCTLEAQPDEWERLTVGDWDFCPSHGDKQIVRLSRIGDK